jgi:hypothetical protein
MISKTEDYSIFKKHPSNRAIDPANLKKIMNSIKVKNMMEIRPITVNDKMEIIDGQHRVEACRNLGVPVFFIVSKESQDQDMILLNNAQKAWRVEDYIHYHASKGLKTYVDIVDLAKKTNLSIMKCLRLAGYDSGKNFHSIKQGIFEKNFENLEQEVREKDFIIKNVVEFVMQKTFGTKVYLKSRAFERALITLVNSKSFVFETFMHKLELQINKMHSCSRVRDYYELFKSIYNFRNSEPLE